MGISRIVPATALLVLAAACGGSDGDAGLPPASEPAASVDSVTESTSPSAEVTTPATDTASTNEQPPATEAFAAPPPIVVRRGDASLELQAWTYCWTGPENDNGERESTCSDGQPPEQLETLGGDGAISVEFPVEFGWGGSAFGPDYQTEVGFLVARGATGAGDELPSVFDDIPDGPAVIELFGAGIGGDVIVTFRID